MCARLLVKANTFVGNPVRSYEGREIGKVRQLLINPEDGKIAYVVVARGGISGSADLIAVPWDDVKVGRDMEKVVIIVDKEISDLNVDFRADPVFIDEEYVVPYGRTRNGLPDSRDRRAAELGAPSRRAEREKRAHLALRATPGGRIQHPRL